MRIQVCGSRGSTPAPGAEFSRYGGHTSSILISRDGERPDLILDAGTGVRQVTELVDGRPFDGSILLGHLHWDHIQGLPFFRAGDHPEARVDVYMPRQEGRPTATLGDVMAPPHFPITPNQLHGDWSFHHLDEGEHLIEGYAVLARQVPHKGGRTFGYRVSDGSATVAYMSDHNPAVLGPGVEGYGPYHDAALALAGDVDVLIHDAQYLESEWESRSHYGHSTPTYAAGLAVAAGAKRLVLFHHDPSRTDAELDRLAESWSDSGSLEIRVARDGQTIDVG